LIKSYAIVLANQYGNQLEAQPGVCPKAKIEPTAVEQLGRARMSKVLYYYG